MCVCVCVWCVEWGWGQWRCPSEGHGRECGLRPSVQSGVPRCRASHRSFSFTLNDRTLSRIRSLYSPSSFSSRLRRTLSGLLALPLSPSRAAAAQTAGMHQMHRTDRCSSRSTASTCLLRPCSRARARVFLSSPDAFFLYTPPSLHLFPTPLLLLFLHYHYH